MNHSNNNNIIKSKKNKYLNKIDRYKIEALKKAGLSNVEIATQVGKYDRTLRRKIKRGTVVLSILCPSV